VLPCDELIGGWCMCVQALFTPYLFFILFYFLCRPYSPWGARRFLLTNVPNLGCLPVGATARFILAPETAGRGCDPAGTELSRAVNTELSPAMAALEASLRMRAGQEELLISHYDTFRALGFIHNRAQQLGEALCHSVTVARWLSLLVGMLALSLQTPGMQRQAHIPYIPVQ